MPVNTSDDYMRAVIRRREVERRHHARKRGEDVPKLPSGGHNKLAADDPRKARAIEMRRNGVPTYKIRDALRLRNEILRAWLKDVPRGKPEPARIAPPPYARGFRWGNTKWA